MKTRLALKLGILAIVALGLLSGCFLVQNTATIRFENTIIDRLKLFDFYPQTSHIEAAAVLVPR